MMMVRDPSQQIDEAFQTVGSVVGTIDVNPDHPQENAVVENKTHKKPEKWRDPAEWGPKYWKVIDIVVKTYMADPTRERKEYIIKYFESLRELLPCAKCRTHYADLLKRNPLESHLVPGKNLANWVKWLKEQIRLSVEKEDREWMNMKMKQIQQERAKEMNRARMRKNMQARKNINPSKNVALNPRRAVVMVPRVLPLVHKPHPAPKHAELANQKGRKIRESPKARQHPRENKALKHANEKKANRVRNKTQQRARPHNKQKPAPRTSAQMLKDSARFYKRPCACS